MKIILDTSFILTGLKFRIDIFSELEKVCDFPYKLYVIDKTLDELKNKPASKLALDLIKAKSIEIIKTKKDRNVDRLMLEIVDKEYLVATQDRELKKKIKNKGIKVITIRQRKYLLLE